MNDLSDQQRQMVAGVAAFFFVTGIIGIFLTRGGKHGTSANILEILGFGEYGWPVFLYTLVALALGISLGYIVRINKSDEERRGV